MKELLEALRQFKGKTQFLLSVADNKSDQAAPMLLQIKAALEKIEGDLHRTITDVEIVKDESEPNAQVFLSAVKEKLPAFESSMQTQEQALRDFE